MPRSELVWGSWTWDQAQSVQWLPTRGASVIEIFFMDKQQMQTIRGSFTPGTMVRCVWKVVRHFKLRTNNGS